MTRLFLGIYSFTALKMYQSKSNSMLFQTLVPSVLIVSIRCGGSSNNPPADTFSYIYLFILVIIGEAGGALGGLIIEAALPRLHHVQWRRCNYTATCGKSGWCL